MDTVYRLLLFFLLMLFFLSNAKAGKSTNEESRGISNGISYGVQQTVVSPDAQNTDW